MAHLQHRHTGPPGMVVTELGVRVEHRDGSVGILLVAAMSEEAAGLDVAEVLALPDRPELARYLRQLGFRPVPRRTPLLTLGR